MSKFLKYMLLIAPVVLIGCIGKSAEEHLNLARKHLQQDDRQAAIIEFKNAISKDNKNLDARIELSRTYLSLGYGEGAEKEANLALNGGADINNVAPIIVKSQKLLENNQELIDQANSFGNLNEGAEIVVNFYKALAYFRLSTPKEAIALINKNSKVNSNSKFSILGQSYLHVHEKDFETAMALITPLLEDEELFVDALFLKGQIKFNQKDFQGAINAFQQYENTVPQDLRVKIILAQAFIKNNDIEAAQQYLDILQKKLPNNSIVNQLLALVHYKKKEFELANKHANFSIQNGLDNTTNRVISGVSAYFLNNNEQAYKNLNIVRNALVNGHPAAKILAAAQLELGYIDEAEDTLMQLGKNELVDSDLFTEAGLLFLKGGEKSKARDMLDISNSIDSNDPDILTRKAILKLSLDDLSAIEDLEKIVEQYPDSMLAIAGLAKAYMDTKDFARALELASEWQKNDKLNVQVAGWNLAGQVHLINGNNLKANQAFQTSLDLYPNNPASLMHFGETALNESKLDSAINMFDKVLQSSPNYIPALTKYYKANKQNGTPKKGLDRIEKSYLQNNTEMVYLLFYASTLRDLGMFNVAARTLDQHKIVDGKLVPDSYWVMLVDSYEKLSNWKDALSKIDEWLYYKPTNLMAFLRKIAFYDKHKQYEKALKATQQALRSIPDELNLKVIEINFLILNEMLNEAQVSLNSLTEEVKATAKIQLLQGRVYKAQSEFKKAESPLLFGYASYPMGANAILIFDNYIALKQTKKAIAFMEEHLNTNPKDTISLAKLGDYQLRNSKEDAVETYKRLLEINENNVVALNNIAWLSIKLKDINSALHYSSKAAKLKPEHAGVLDTHGLALLASGQKQEAYEVLQKAASLAPNSIEINTHLEQARQQLNN